MEKINRSISVYLLFFLTMGQLNQQVESIDINYQQLQNNRKEKQKVPRNIVENNTAIRKEDSNEVEEFLVSEGNIPENEGRSFFPNDNPIFGNNPYPPDHHGNDPRPFYPNDFGHALLEGFTARQVIEKGLYPGARIRFWDTITHVSFFMRNIFFPLLNFMVCGILFFLS